MIKKKKRQRHASFTTQLWNSFHPFFSFQDNEQCSSVIFPVTWVHMPGSSASSALQAWDKKQILTSFQKLWSSRHQKWTISHNHRKILCYPEVTRTSNHLGLREPRCLRSSAAPQNQFSSCVIRSSVVTIPHSSCREANFFCKCR